MTLDDLLDALADRIALRIRSQRERETYSSQDLPPRCSRRRFRELCKSGRVVGAMRDGRSWTCTREAWESARRHAPRKTAAPIAAKLNDRADALLASSGLRIVGGRGR